MEALIAGEREVEVLADTALTRSRARIPELRLALEGGFGEQHAFMPSTDLDTVDHLSAQTTRLNERLEVEIAPFARQVERLCTVIGSGKVTAEGIVAEIGVDTGRFPTAAHLASRAGMSPGNHESAGKRRSGKARNGNAALRSALIEAAWAASRSKSSYYAALYRRFCRRFGKKSESKAIFVVAHSMLVTIWRTLANESDYADLGADWFDRRGDNERHARRLADQIERLGHEVTVEPVAA